MAAVVIVFGDEARTMAEFTRQDEGKPVRIGGETVGTVVIGDDDAAYVAPSEDAPDRVTAKLD